MFLYLKSLSLILFLNSSASIEIVKIPIEFIPGKHQMVILNVTNHSEIILQPDVQLDLPKGWSIIAAPPKFKLNPNESKRLIYTISLSVQAEKGNGSFSVSLSNQGVEIQKKTIPIVVKKIHTINVEVLHKPNYLKDGGEFSCDYLITNKGNVNENLKLKSRKGAIVGVTELFLPIDSSKIISVKQLIPKSTSKQIIVNDLSVLLEETDTIFTKNTPITVYPNQRKNNNIYKTFPVDGSFLFNSIDNSANQISFFQYDINGKGFIDRKENHYLEFIAKGTTNSGVERFETINRHLLSYKFKKSKIQIGDFTFGLSRLLENIRLGRGVIVNQDIGKYSFVIFYNELLFFPTIKSQMGSSIGYMPNKRLSFKLNAIYRSYILPENNSIAFSGFTNYSNENTFIKAELATSIQNQKYGYGAYINGLHKNKKVQLSTDTMFTGKDFQGFYSNSIFNATNLNVIINRFFSISANLNYNYTNPKDDLITAQVAPFSQSYSTAIQYSKNTNSSHKMSVNYRNNSDRSKFEKFNYEENSVRYSYKFKTERLSFQFHGEIAETNNKVALDTYSKGTSFTTALSCNYSIKKKLKWAFLPTI